MHTGIKIKELRKANNLTQEELGRKLGVKKSAIQKYEKGEIVNLKLDTIKKLCEIFNITPGSLIFPKGDDYDKLYGADKLRFEVKVLESIDILYGKNTVEIIQYFVKLNKRGQSRAIDTIYDMTLLAKYSE